MVPNIDGTVGHKIKTKNTQDMEHSALFSVQQTETQHSPFKKCNKKEKKEKKEEKKFIQIKSIWYYNVYIHKLKLSINYSD